VIKNNILQHERTQSQRITGHTVPFPWMSGMGKSTETESRLVAARGSGEGGKWGMLINGDRVSFGVMKVLQN